jgi:hypothetical protein
MIVLSSRLNHLLNLLYKTNCRIIQKAYEVLFWFNFVQLYVKVDLANMFAFTIFKGLKPDQTLT